MKRSVFFRYCLHLVCVSLFAISSAAAATTTIYRYDANGRLTKAVFSGNKAISYAYDDAGNITRVCREAGGSAACDATPPAISLSVLKSGAGQGVVTSDDDRINCGATCAAANYIQYCPVTLHAAASAGSVFTGWSGDCIGTGDCDLTLDGSKSVTATFVVPTVSIAATDPTATEAGPTTGQFTVTRTGATAAALAVNYAKTGTATAGSDYTGSGASVTIPAGAASATITVTPIDDTVDESDETVIVTLSANAAYVVGSPSFATVTIADNDPAPSVQFTQVSSSGLETTPTATIGVNLSAASGRTVTVDYATANGTAIAGSDYTAKTGTLSFAPGVSSQTIQVPITIDTIPEPDETFTVTLSNPVNATPGAIIAHTRAIYDDGVPGVAGLKTIAEALDQLSWTFATTVGANWWLQSAVTHDGTDAARSGFVADNQVSSFQTTGSFGAGTLSFWWKVSSEPGADELRFSIDGTVKDTISGEVGWQQKSYPVAAGSRTLKWEYAKNGSGAGGIDAAWVDQLVLPAALVLWTRGDSGEANLWSGSAGALTGALAITGQVALTTPSGEAGPWEATSGVHADPSAVFVLWSHGDTGQAVLAKVNPGSLPDSRTVGDWAYLNSPDGQGGPWQATSYTHVDTAIGYVLWSRSDTGQAILAQVAPGEVSGTIPVTSWAALSAPAGVGGSWQASSFAYVDSATGYVLWNRGETGQALLAKVIPGDVSGTIPVTSWAYLGAPAGVGAPWQATSYTHIDALEGYVLWTRNDTGQAILWKVAPGEITGTIPVTSWDYVSSPRGVGGPWRATSYVHGATPATPAAAGVNPDDE